MTEHQEVRCRRCGRRLSNPIRRATGIGAVCQRKEAAEQLGPGIRTKHGYQLVMLGRPGFDVPSTRVIIPTR